MQNVGRDIPLLKLELRQEPLTLAQVARLTSAPPPSFIFPAGVDVGLEAPN